MYIFQITNNIIHRNNDIWLDPNQASFGWSKPAHLSQYYAMGDQLEHFWGSAQVNRPAFLCVVVW